MTTLTDSLHVRPGDSPGISEIELHGHRVCFRLRGDGPPVVLIHGITGRSSQWEPAIDELEDGHTLLAPDLLGHGESAKPRGDYSLGAYASAVRDTMVALGHDRATIVGHSLGGGIAMQFAYQFPERCERLVLVSSGGLGREVHPMLRAATLPGSECRAAAAHPRHACSPPARRSVGRSAALRPAGRARPGRGRARLRLARRVRGALTPSSRRCARCSIRVASASARSTASI